MKNAHTLIRPSQGFCPAKAGVLPLAHQKNMSFPMSLLVAKTPAFGSNHSNHLDEFALFSEQQAVKAKQAITSGEHSTMEGYLSSSLLEVPVENDGTVRITPENILEEIVRQSLFRQVYRSQRCTYWLSFFRREIGYPHDHFIPHLPKKDFLQCLRQLESFGLITQTHRDNPDFLPSGFYVHATDKAYVHCQTFVDQLKNMELEGCDQLFCKLPEDHPFQKIKAFEHYKQSPEHAYQQKEDEIQTLLSEVITAFTPEGSDSKAVYGWDLLDAFDTALTRHFNETTGKHFYWKDLKTSVPFKYLPWKQVKVYFTKLIAMGLVAQNGYFNTPSGNLYRGSLFQLALQNTQPFIDQLKSPAPEDPLLS